MSTVKREDEFVRILLLFLVIINFEGIIGKIELYIPVGKFIA